MFEYFFIYNIANKRNRIIVIEETNDEEGSEGESAASDIDIDDPSTSYSRNVMIYN
jgi:hypothetical protein